MDNTRQKMWRALPFVMAMLLATLLPLNASALFGSKKSADAPVQGAPIAQNLEIEAYHGVAFTGTLKAVDNEGEAVTFAIVTMPAKGTVELDGETFVYTPDKNKAGGDSFTYTATDESGNVSAPATVKIKISRVASGVEYSDTEGKSCATAAVDLAEHGVFTGAKIGADWFFEPDRAVSRGEFVAMAMAAAGLDSADVTVTGFCDDEAIPTWAKSYAAGALAAGVVQGVATEDGVAFRANSDVTLSEAAAVLNRVLSVTDVDLTGFYEDETPAWCAQAVANLESVSIVPAGGFSDADLSRGVTRGEAAELLSAAITLVEARGESGGLLKTLLG